jgi:LuxR family transcriptional regulator, maltose regulon positive regulatory protein
MIQAIQRAAPGVGTDALDLIRETFLISPRAIVSTLLNDLTEIEDEMYLFLEDYHWLTPGIHDAVNFFLRHAPSQAHLVLPHRPIDAYLAEMLDGLPGELVLFSLLQVKPQD